MEWQATEIVMTLRKRGFEAYFAGGCVRDMLMGATPKDYDIVTAATPDEIVRIFPRTVQVGKAFGVIVVMIGDLAFDVATFRSDGTYSDGRRPDSVTFSDHRGDVLRRDFTINGLLYDPAEQRVIDLVDGEQDIRNKIVRTIGDPAKRFDEDKLRMMRAVRFACRLDFRIEETTMAAIKAQSGTITRISFERIREELRHILTCPRRAEGVELLHRLGLLRPILPEVADMEGVPQPPQYHPEGDVFTHTMLCLRNLENPTFEIALATLLHDVGKPRTITFPTDPSDRIRFNAHEIVGEKMTAAICRRLRLSLDETKKICWMVAKHMTFKDVPKMRESTLKRFLSNDDYADLEQLYVADKRAADGDMTDFEYIRTKRAQFKEEDLKPKPLLTGADLIAMGYSPGPLFGTILEAVMDEQLEGNLHTKEEAERFVRATFKQC